MSAVVMATLVEGESVIYNAEAVNKSYPTFFEDYKKLGGVIEYD
jgi:3-phosphoshikimate 1-carboxyvinyltransferase